MSNETAHHCDRCGADYFYAPTSHRCAGEWAAMVTPLPATDTSETWAEECVRRVMAP